MPARYGNNQILPVDDYGAAETIVQAVRDLIYHTAENDPIDWATFRVRVESLDVIGRLVVEVRVDGL
jgi:hypothetical protein